MAFQFNSPSALVISAHAYKLGRRKEILSIYSYLCIHFETFALIGIFGFPRFAVFFLLDNSTLGVVPTFHGSVPIYMHELILRGQREG